MAEQEKEHVDGKALTWVVAEGRQIDVSRPVIMGVINVTPDSFYAGSRNKSVEKALAYAAKMAEEGAEIIDIGGESSRPGSRPVSQEEEENRVVPLIKAVKKHLGVIVSCDTWKPEVAEKAIESGASIINDISAFSLDGGMAETLKKSGCGYVLMHMKGTPMNMQNNPFYEDAVAEILEFLAERLKTARESGIDTSRVVIDPGIGFGKRIPDNLSVIANIERFLALGRPVLVGASRKSFIGAVLGGLPPEERLEGSLAVAAAAYLKGARIFRVHDVKETRRVLTMLETLSYAEQKKDEK